MITKLLIIITKAGLYIKNHPQILFALALLILIPLLFLYTGQQFLDVGYANQERLQKDRVGLMHDTLSSLLIATDFNIEVAHTELQRIMVLNPDIVDFTIAKLEGTEIVAIIEAHTEEEGIKKEERDLYKNAALRNDESIIFEYYENNERLWSAYRSIETASGEMYFLNTVTSLALLDTLFESREKSAYFSLVFVYLFMIALAFWHIRLTDYRYLYIKAQKTNETKDLFTNMMAHELRAPLTAILGYGSMLEEKVQNQEEKKYAHRIKESAERLLLIINDLLDVARLQSGKLTVSMADTDVTEVVKSVLAELHVSASQKSITLAQEGMHVQMIVSSDQKRLHQALINLVSNAIKYTEKGTITLSVEDKHAYVEIRVKDTGMGISSEDQKHLFAPFFRVSDPDVSQITGTGLGMWITKELIELIGAKIGIESIRGVGTHVVIALPKTIRIS